MPAISRLPVLSELFSDCVSGLFKYAVPKDFLCLAASAMSQLSIGGRTNVLYNLAKGMGTLRSDSKDSRFPINQMPMGLIEYAAQFFAFDNLQQVKRELCQCNVLIIFPYASILSHGLSYLATDCVFQLWRKMDKVTSWTNVVLCKCNAEC